MNHQLIKEWLLSEEPLTPEQSESLQEHLRSCPACQQTERSWKQINQLFRASSQIAPAQGFTDRWRTRLDAHKKHIQRRQSWFLFGITAGAAALSILMILLQAWVILSSPNQLLLLWTYRLGWLVTAMVQAGNYIETVLHVIPVFPVIGLVLFTGFISILCVLWYVAFHQLAIARRFVL